MLSLWAIATLANGDLKRDRFLEIQRQTASLSTSLWSTENSNRKRILIGSRNGTGSVVMVGVTVNNTVQVSEVLLE